MPETNTPQPPVTETPPKTPEVVEFSGTEKIINVYLIGGQSNAVGYGMDTGYKIAASDERFIDGFDNVLYFGAQERWSTEEYPDKAFAPVKLGYGVDFNRSGAEIGIASAIADEGEMNAIIKCAWGATHLYPDTYYDISLRQGTWTSPSYINKHHPNTNDNPLIGRMYNWFKDTVFEGLRLLKEQGYTPVIKGMWWMQGEAEMFTPEMSSAYEELLETLIFDVRSTLSEITGYDLGEMPFVCGLPKWNTNNGPAPAYQEKVRDAMSGVADRLLNVGTIDCMTLTQHDDWHFDAAGQKYLGERFVSTVKLLQEGYNDSFLEKVSIENDIELLASEKGLEFTANLTNCNSNNNYEYGMLFVPTNKLLNNNITSDYILELESKKIEYQNVKCDIILDEIDNNFHDIYFKGSIKNIDYDNINTSYTAIAYIKDKDKYLYSSSFVATSLSALASKVLYTQEGNNKDVLAIVNAGVNRLNNLDESNSTNTSNLELISDDIIELRYGEAMESVNINLVQSPKANYYVKYTSSNPNVVSVDELGNLRAYKLGTATIKVECGGKTKEILVNVDYASENGVCLDGVINSGEYVGSVIKKSNNITSLEASGMIKSGNLYLAVKFTHGKWSSYANDWWLNDNIEFKLNNGTSHTIIFYEGVAVYSRSITRGMSKTEEVNGKLVTTVELVIENVEDAYQFQLFMNGNGVGWFGAIWHEHYNVAYITKDGIITSGALDLGDGLVLDGELNEPYYTYNVRNNKITTNANGASVEIMGTLLEKGVLFATIVEHTKAPNVSVGGNGDWYTYTNIEFNFLNNTKPGHIFTTMNISRTHSTFAYCKSVKSGSKYVSTFEIFVPYEVLGLNENVKSIDFTTNGWFETGWCWMWGYTDWRSTHRVTTNGITRI